MAENDNATDATSTDGTQEKKGIVARLKGLFS